MYIVAIGWLFVALLVALTAQGFLAGVAGFLGLGVLPLALLLWIAGTPQRRRQAASRQAADEGAHQRD